MIYYNIEDKNFYTHPFGYQDLNYIVKEFVIYKNINTNTWHGPTSELYLSKNNTWIKRPGLASQENEIIFNSIRNAMRFLKTLSKTKKKFDKMGRYRWGLIIND